MLLSLLATTTIVLIFLGISLGPVSLSLDTVWQVVLSKLGISTGNVTALQHQIVWELRVPRVLLGLLVGAGLAVAGTAIQAIVRNPLGDPYLIGIVPGATLGAVIAIVSGAAVGSRLPVSGAAFVGGLAAFVLTFLLSRQGGQ